MTKNTTTTPGGRKLRRVYSVQYSHDYGKWMVYCSGGTLTLFEARKLAREKNGGK